MKRYWLTGKQTSKSSAPSTLSGGWNTTTLMLAAAQGVSQASPDRSLTLNALVIEVNRLVWLQQTHFVGTTNHPERYTSPVERVVHGRFGDMLRSGFFTSVPPPIVVGVAPLKVRVESPKPPSSLEDQALLALKRHGRLTERDLSRVLNTRRVAGIMAHLADKLPPNALRIEDAGESGSLYILTGT
jgi:hypothetical protein